MGIDLIAHVCIPLLAGLVLILFVAAAEKQPISWASCNDIGIDLAILSIGANGAIFVNPVLIKHWGGATGVYGILVVLADLIFAGILVYRKRWRDPEAISWWAGVFDLFWGCLAVGTTASVLHFGLKG